VVTNDKKPKRWKVGELAEVTGLTVRTLHHYESIGLLKPGGRTEGQQRIYDERDVRRLYRILALRDLGLSLTEIKETLAEEADLGDVLRQHRDRVDEEMKRLGQLRTLLDHASSHAEDDVEDETLLLMIEAMARVVRRGDEQQPTAMDRWQKIAVEIRACMDAGEAPSSARAQAVAREAMEGIVAFAGGDAATIEALAYLRKVAPPKDGTLPGWDAAMMRYLDEALDKQKETK
jgi:MerR family transcriptional regulator, thiopeptide resistance regulator